MTVRTDGHIALYVSPRGNLVAQCRDCGESEAHAPPRGDDWAVDGEDAYLLRVRGALEAFDARHEHGVGQ